MTNYIHIIAAVWRIVVGYMRVGCESVQLMFGVANVCNMHCIRPGVPN